MAFSIAQLTAPFAEGGQPTKFRLADHDPEFDGGLDKREAQEAQAELVARLSALQDMLYAQGKQSLLVIFQAMDAAGKDSTIKRVFGEVNPLGVQVTPFKQPSPAELAHDFLWRVHPHMPGKGMIAVFNRSHYEDVLVVRVNSLVPEAAWRRRYDHINAFERLLTDEGTHIIKFFLNISRAEQKKRLQDRLTDPSKQWKFSHGDLPVRAQWDAYMAAYQEAIARCSAPQAPWIVVPANNKWMRDYVVTRALVELLETMNPAYPPPEAGLDTVVIPD